MRGLTSIYPPGPVSPTARAAVDAVKAGDDVILWPTDLDGAFQGILAAVNRGEIPEARINESVRKILEMKASVGLHKARLVNLDQVSRILNRPQDMAFAQQIACRRNDPGSRKRTKSCLCRNWPLLRPRARHIAANVPPSVQVVTVIITDTVQGDWGRGFVKAL